MKKISATLVKNLREKTGLGMMDCKKALLISNGDLDLALEELRKSSGLKANKKAGRPTGDGIISTFLNESLACMVEVNCETDFVVKDESFVSYTKDVIGKLVSNVDLTLEEAMEEFAPTTPYAWRCFSDGNVIMEKGFTVPDYTIILGSNYLDSNNNV